MKRKLPSALPIQYKSNILLKNTFIKRGNAERSLGFLIKLYTLLRRITKRRRLFVPTISRKRAVYLIDYLLYKLQPGFIIRRVIAAGKPYMLPVPISDHRASYLACKWLRHAVLLETKKNRATIPQLLLKEIVNIRRKKGVALQVLADYIKVAVDQRPFSRFIRKKHKQPWRKYHRIFTSKQRLNWRRKRRIRWKIRRRGFKKTRYFKAIKGKRRFFRKLRRVRYLYRHNSTLPHYLRFNRLWYKNSKKRYKSKYNKHQKPKNDKTTKHNSNNPYRRYFYR